MVIFVFVRGIGQDPIVPVRLSFSVHVVKPWDTTYTWDMAGEVSVRVAFRYSSGDVSALEGYSQQILIA